MTIRKSVHQPESPRRTANPLSCLAFSWIIPLFVKGYYKDLVHEDVYRVLPEDETKMLADRMEAAWMEQVAASQKKYNERKAPRREAKGRGEGDIYSKLHECGMAKPSLVKALIKRFGPTTAAFGVIAFLNEAVFKIVQPIMLGYLLDFFDRPEEHKPYHGYLYAAGVLTFTILYTTTDHPFTFASQHLGMKMRISMCALVYRKALRVSKYAMEQTPAGQIINFLSSDMNRFDVFFTFCHYLWVAPVQLLHVILVLYFHANLGYASLSGLALFCFFIPFQALMGLLFCKLRAQTAEKTDERLLAMEEILTAIRVIKMYTWETPLSALVSDCRREEVSKLKKTAVLRALNQSFFSVTSRLTLFITLLIYVFTGHTLTARTVYVTFSLYTAVQTVMTMFFPLAVIGLAEILVAVHRIHKFLLLEEKSVPVTAIRDSNVERFRRYDWQYIGDSGSQPHSQASFGSASFDSTHLSEIGIWARNISAQWNPTNTIDCSFTNVTFDLKGGELMGIIGPTAAGKSSILHGLLYELPLKSGDFRIMGKLAYACQEPWIFNGTLRDNILFGKPYNAHWYDEVTAACALTRDFQLLPYADRSQVGEKGSELSGGQKARVTLARAVYADADIYFLDDPLSAVDAEVGRQIMENCILGLLRNKCRLLVTNQLQHVKNCDKVLLMVNGSVAHFGDYESLQLSGIPFAQLVHSKTNLKLFSSGHQSVNTKTSRSGSRSELSHGAPVEKGASSVEPMGLPLHPRDTKLSLVGEDDDEVLEGGRVGFRTVYHYFRTGNSICGVLMMIFVYVLTQSLLSGSDIYLKTWIQFEKADKLHSQALSSNPIVRVFQTHHSARIGGYTALIFLLFIMAFARGQMFFMRCMASSTKVYDKLFTGVIRSPLGFFERTPVGRILNRFAKDIAIIDENLPQALYDVIEIICQTFGILIILALYSVPLLIPSVFLILGLDFLRKFYFRSAIAIKRLEGVARSPIFNQLATTLQGLTTIRAFGVEAKFNQEYEEIHDVHNSCWYLFLAGTRWLGITVDWMALTFISSVVVFFLVTFDKSHTYEDSKFGVMLSSALMLTSMLQWGMRQSAEMENHLTSFQRVVEYCKLPSEAALESLPDRKPPPSWPYFGDIRIQNLYLRYVETNYAPVLKNITCRIKGGEKIGIVGRTGAGKSSLINALFRLSEPTSGYIEIDGIDICTIGLHDLRGRISIIPQEPVVFGGTLRINLDPFSQYSDEQLWLALKEVNLYETVKAMELELYCEMSEGGSNISTGQKQLLCLARCILKRNKILVLDEATANVDPETDRLIQRTIRENFADCTILTVAHRLHTIMDSDRILVLQAGQIMEFDEPNILLENTGGILYNLVQHTGRTEAANLTQIAKLAALRRRQALHADRDSKESGDTSQTTLNSVETDTIVL